MLTVSLLVVGCGLVILAVFFGADAQKHVRLEVGSAARPPDSNGEPTGKAGAFMAVMDEGRSSNQAEPNKSSGPPSSAPPAIREAPAKPELSLSEPGEIYKTLEGRNALARPLVERKKVELANRTTRILQAETAAMDAQAAQIKNYLTSRNEIGELESERKLQPLRHSEKEAGLHGAIAESEAKQAESRAKLAKSDYEVAKFRKDTADLNPPPPPPSRQPPPRPSRKEQLRKFREEMEEANREIDKEFEGDPNAAYQMKRDVEEKFKRKMNDIYGP